MRINTSVNKFICALLCLCMLAQNVPVMAFAAAGDNLCAHHAEHTAECGYEEGLTDCAFQCADCKEAEEQRTATEPTVPETTEPTVPETTEPTVPETTEPTVTETTEPTVPETTEPTVPETTEPTVPETSEPTEPTIPETSEPTEPTEETEPEPECTCETDDPACHATNCPCYEAPAEPQCFCVEKCSEPNFWCDVCGFDISRCGGEDTAVTYDCTHGYALTLAHVSGSEGNGGEGSENLFDNNSGTKWCYKFGGSETYVIFKAEQAAVLKSYALTTGNDTAEYPGRNWKDWTLYGSNSADGNWTQIQKVRSAELPAENKTESQPIAVPEHTAYTHFKLVVTAIESGTTQQMAELTATGSLFVDGVCTKCNFSCQSHEYENGFCKVCGTACAHDLSGTDTCLICGYVCLHDQYNTNGECSLCGAACPHTKFANSVCKECGFTCTHIGKYENGFCTVCKVAHIHAREDYDDAGVCTTCNYRCPHEAVLKLNLIDGSDNNVLGLLDGNPNTQWGDKFNGDGTSWIIFTAGDSALLKSYKLTTSVIADIAPEFTWKSWTIYGRNDEEEWTRIHWVKDAQLPEVSNVVTDAYVPYISNPYDQFKLVVNAIASGSSNSQHYMSDITVTGFLFKDGSCSECGYICQSHTYSGGICTVCGFGCPHESFDGIVCTNCLFACPHPQFGTDRKCIVCKIVCPHASGYDKKNHCCKACGTPCDHQKEGYSDTGFCKSCDQAEPAPLVEGVYKISKAGHLYWFADQVNTGLPDKTNINGELTCNIDLKANTPTDGNWGSMGSTKHPYQGTLDGKGYTIDNVKIWGERYVGFICAIGNSGKVINLGLGQQCSISGYEYTGGICGKNDGRIEGCWYRGKLTGRGIANNSEYIGGTAGGIAGENNHIIINCWFDGQMNEGGTGMYYPCDNGGIAGSNINGTVENCYNMGKIYGWQRYGGIVGLGGTVKHCYSLMPIRKVANDGNCQTPNGIGGSTIINSYHEGGISRDTFATGELAYTLQQGTGSDELVWGQNLDNGNPRDDYPTLAYHGAPRVYRFTNCVKDVVYSNTKGEDGDHWPVVNGMCPCGEQAYAPKQENGVYLISNAGELLWFARKCNEKTYAQLNARLTADIVVNENALSGTHVIQWPVIENFWGDFNGDGHTISGLYVAQTDGESAGMFAYVQAGGSFNGTIRNLSIVDSYISGIGAVGGIVGNLAISGKVENCSFSGTVVCTDGVTVGTETYDYAGGLVGHNNGTVQNSYANASVSCPDETGAYAGGVVGYNRYSKPQNCYYNSTKFKGYPSGNDTYNGESFQDWHLDHFEEDRTTQQFASGEVAYLMQRYYEEEMSGEDLLWGQTIGTNAYPKLGGAKVYAIKDCLDKTSYSNTNVYGRHEYGSDGMCACGAYYTALLEVDLSWGEMAFTYTEGSWNPQTHTYEEGGWTADTDGGNQISVTNQGNVPVKVNLSYEAGDDHTGIRGTFTDSAGNALVEAVYLEKRKSDTYGLTLSGAPDQSLHGDGLGTIKVAISNGWQVGDTVSHVAKNGLTYTCYVAVVSEDNVVLVGAEADGAYPDAVQTQLDEIGARVPDKNKPEFEAFIKPRIQNGTYFTDLSSPAYIVDNDSIYQLYRDENTGELIGRYGPSKYSYKLIPVWDVPIP